MYNVMRVRLSRKRVRRGALASRSMIRTFVAAKLVELNNLQLREEKALQPLVGLLH
jgi:hypothetical protein